MYLFRSGSLNPGLVLAGIAAGSSAQEFVDPSIMMMTQSRPGSSRTPPRPQLPMAPLGPRGRNPPDPYFNRNRNTFLQQNYPGYPGGNSYPGGGGSSYPGSGGSNYPGSGGSNYPGSGGSNYPGSGGSNYPGGVGSGYPGGGYPGGGFPGGSYPGSGSNSIKKGWAATMSGKKQPHLIISSYLN